MKPKAAAAAVATVPAAVPAAEPAGAAAPASETTAPSVVHAQPSPADPFRALVEAGVRVLESIAAGNGSPAASLEGALRRLVRTDPESGSTALSIPLPPSVTVDRIAGALAGLLQRFAGGK